MSRASVERFRTEQVCGRDAVMGVPTRWAVGYSLEPPAPVPGVPPMHGPNDGAFGHMGAGGQIGFADPSARVALRLRAQSPGEPGAAPHGRLPGRRAVLMHGERSDLGGTVYAAEHAAEHPDHAAIVMAPSGRTLTFAQYEAGANQVAHLLRETGLRRQDHMAIFMENDPAMLLAEAGAERTGLYFTPVNSYLSAEEVAYIVNDSESRVVVTSAAKAEVAQQLPALCPKVERWIMVGRPRRTLRVVGRGGGHPDDRLRRRRATRRTDDVLVGDHGAAQGDPAPHVRHPPVGDQHRCARHPGLWRFREDMVYLSPAPLYHTAPQVSVAIALRLKSTAVVMEHFDPALYLDLMGRTGSRTPRSCRRCSPACSSCPTTCGRRPTCPRSRS